MNIMSELMNLDIKEDVIDELKKEKLPLVMWGSGELADEINQFLKKNQIHISAFYLDDDYFIENMMFDNLAVSRFEDLKRKYNKFNVIVGHSNYEKISLIEKKEEINKVFCMFSVNYGIYKKTSIEEIRMNQEEFEENYELFEDEKSKCAYLALLKTRVSGNIKYVLEAYHNEMNFFNNDIFAVKENECFLDIGAYDGDTIRLFLKECKNKYQEIYALEPDDINRKKLIKYIEEKKIENVHVSAKGAWDKKCILSFGANKEQISSVINDEGIEGKVQIEAEPLDTLFTYNKKITMLKINYLEGVEEALRGAKGILEKDMPKLAITIGFNCDNIRKIPKLIKMINPEYKLYLRYNRGMTSTLTLYGIV